MSSKGIAKKLYLAIFLFIIIQVVSCESQYTNERDGDASKTGNFSFTLGWPDGTPMNLDDSTASRGVNCTETGIETIVAAFYNSSEKLLNNPPDEFNCIDGNGKVEGLPPGSGYRVLVNGKDIFGDVLYQGAAAGITIVAGRTTPGGEIQMNLVVSPSCTDNDSDSYFIESGCGTALDCNDNDENINHGAIEVCNDGTDNDCDGDKDCDDSSCAGYVACTVDPNADYSNSIGMTFNIVPSGNFTMGSPLSELGRVADESQHSVTLTRPFYMQTTEVTQGQWKALTGVNPSYFRFCGSNCPVEMVSWADIQSVIVTLNAIGEGTYRLPTEAEWEYSARAGSNTAFANGDATVLDCSYDANLDDMGWYCYNSEVSYDGCADESASGGPACAGPHPVAQKNANAWGLHDMHGNVDEWVQDWFEVELGSDPITDPIGPSTGSARVIRSGSWIENARDCRSANRGYDSPNYRGSYIGFRLVFEPIDPIIRVPEDYVTIQAAIDAAADGDTILVADGTYVTPGPDGIDFKGKAITVRSQNGPENCTINAGGSGRGFYFHSNELATSVLSGFTITNGVIDGWSTGGGGILCDGASPTIKNCIITNNRTEAIAWGGGGISCVTSASPTIENCVIDGNSSIDADGGGGIYCDNASPIIRNCTIVNNSSGTDTGGGIYIFGPSSTTITNSIFWGNTSDQIDFSSASPNVTYSDIEGGFTGTGNINSNPVFAGAGIYSLGSGSPCIDTGTASGAPDSDIAGVTRPQGSGYDMGAYEYQ